MTKKIKLVPSLQAHWFEACKLYAEAIERYDEAAKIYAEDDKLFAKTRKLYAEGGKLQAKGNTNFSAAVAATNGPNTRVRWTGEGCTVGEGPNAKTYLFAEPL